MNQRSSVKWSSYTATRIAEGFGSCDNPEEETEAWAYLIENELCWRLQSCFRKQAQSFIESGLISSEGIIDWELFDLNV